METCGFRGRSTPGTSSMTCRAAIFPQPANEPEAVQTIAAILALPAEEVAARPVVRVRGFVTRINRGSCIVQD
jgi:hypothetical protein